MVNSSPADPNKRFLSLVIIVVWGWTQLVDAATVYRPHLDVMRISRNAASDNVLLQPPAAFEECTPEDCVGFSSGTATLAATSNNNNENNPNGCLCQCHLHLPVFRDDLKICVDDLNECQLSPFVGGSTSQNIPFVFLPLKGQIIHPSKEIRFPGIQRPICAVSSAQFLWDHGWLELRNPLDADVPFRLFRDEGRTYLQWVGEPMLRTQVSGRLVLIRLMCRDLFSTNNNGSGDVINVEKEEPKTLFTPCVAFRIAGSPDPHLTSTTMSSNISEVAFSFETSSDVEQLSADGSEGVSIYAIFGICSLLLGLIYIASVLLYLHIRKRPNASNVVDVEPASRDDVVHSHQFGNCLETPGIIKTNPLHHHQFFGLDSTTNSECSNQPSSITNNPADNNCLEQSNTKMETSTTSVVVHQRSSSSIDPSTLTTTCCQDAHTPNNIERLPEADVSIVETLMVVDQPAVFGLRSTSSLRRKLYFNPAYFEPHLLVAPPPAAIEFLEKIREVIGMAKQKMHAKRFSPSLMRIPEENDFGQSILDDLLKDLGQRSSDEAFCSIQKWLEDVSVKRKPSKMTHSIPYPPPDMINEAIAVDAEEADEEDVIPNTKVDYSPSSSNALPLDEEITMQNDRMFMVDSKSTNTECSFAAGKINRRLPELLQMQNTASSASPSYSLVSEVYVNNGYKYESSSSLTSSLTDSSECSSTVEPQSLKIKYEAPEIAPAGKLLIEVDDCANNYIPVNDADGFEPDTLDRKPPPPQNQQRNKTVLNCDNDDNEEDTTLFIDSLERPAHYQLKSGASFNAANDTALFVDRPPPSIINSTRRLQLYRSLREIYEARTQQKQSAQFQFSKQVTSKCVLDLEERHCRRQRPPSLTKPLNALTPDVVPPPPPTPLLSTTPQKNVICRSVTGDSVSTPAAFLDAGYNTSTADSLRGKVLTNNSDSEGSLCLGDDDEGGDESGAESIETHSVFFDCFRKPSSVLSGTGATGYGSMDSGVNVHGGDENCCSDSEPANFRNAYLCAKT